MKTGLTTGFCKGTTTSDLDECIEQLKACASDISHPLLLPVIICCHELSIPKVDTKQRETREWLRRLEHVTTRPYPGDEDLSLLEGGKYLDAVNRDLVACHSQVLWKRPAAYLNIVASMNEAMEIFEESLPQEKRDAKMERLHFSFSSRLKFYKTKLQGLESYSSTTWSRLEVQRNLVRLHYF